MRLESEFGLGLGLALAVSADVARRRRRAERARRKGLRGTSVMPDGRGREIEYHVCGATDGTAPVVYCENGLGSPLESWDWLAHLLAPWARVVRYHRGGYSRSTSQVSSTRASELVLREQAPTGPVHLVAHSIGALAAANTLVESDWVRERAKSLTLIDPTDAQLLDAERGNRRKVGFNQQLMVQDALGAITGLNRWGINRLWREVEYRPDIQEAFVTESLTPRTLWNARREYCSLATVGQHQIGKDIPTTVIAASDKETQQRRLAERLEAAVIVLPNSSHRSVIGRLECAEAIAEHVKGRFS